MELNTFVESGHQFSKAPLEAMLATSIETRSQQAVVEERLPFSVRIVGSDEQLDKAVLVRHAAYGRHIPAVAALLEKAEASDSEPGTVVLLAESKLDGSPLGTMRIQTNRYRKLALEQSVDLPSWLHGSSHAEATRLGVALGRAGRLVKTALFKAYYEYCVMEEIEWMVIAARSPLDRQYEALLFQDVLPDGGFIPMRHAGNIPHRVLAFNIAAAETNWRKAGHPLCGFVFDTRHPDIDLGATTSPFSAQTRYQVRAAA
jgi:hypothetical protein